MNGAFKGLKQSDVYLTSYISKKQWQVTSGSFENLGISKIEAISGSLPYVDLGPVMSIYEWEPTPNYEDYRTYRRLKAAGETDEYIRVGVLTQYSGSSHDTQWSNLVNWSGGYYPKLAYRGFNISYYEGALPSVGSFTGSCDLDLQSTITLQGGRQLPETILAYQIPRDCFGENIEPGSITISGSNCNLIDREGLILQQSGSKSIVVGDVIYTQGLLLLDKDKVDPVSESLSWTSEVTINTWNVRCVVKDLEYNYSYNRTITEENRELLGTSEFTPYITTVGLYNRAGELMAIAKLSKPIRKNDNIDMTFKVNIDIS